jgi:hypothetical protein
MTLFSLQKELFIFGLDEGEFSRDTGEQESIARFMQCLVEFYFAPIKSASDRQTLFRRAQTPKSLIHVVRQTGSPSDWLDAGGYEEF